MADKVLRWYIDGKVSRTKTEVGGIYTLGKDYVPIYCIVSVRVTGKGSTPTIVDIHDDGTSIFGAAGKPALTEHQTDHKWTTISGLTMREDSKITLDIDQIFNEAGCRDMTVELGLQEA